MAKSKINLDSKQIQDWLAQHIEKLALVFCAGLFCWMAYASVSIKGYKNTPQDLLSKIGDANNRISNANTGWDIVSRIDDDLSRRIR